MFLNVATCITLKFSAKVFFFMAMPKGHNFVICSLLFDKMLTKMWRKDCFSFQILQYEKPLFSLRTLTFTLIKPTDFVKVLMQHSFVFRFASFTSLQLPFGGCGVQTPDIWVEPSVEEWRASQVHAVLQGDVLQSLQAGGGKDRLSFRLPSLDENYCIHAQISDNCNF